MSAETENHPPTVDSGLRLQPFARRMSEQCPELWGEFVAACAANRVDAPGLSPEQFIRRCLRSAHQLNRQLGGAR